MPRNSSYPGTVYVGSALALREVPWVIEVERVVIELNADWNASTRAYRALNARTLIDYLASREGIAQRLGGSAKLWQAEERGDGNLNLVFVVTGACGALVVKQALPYVRMVGPSWPLPVTRSHYELAALVEQTKWGAAYVPEIYDSDHELALIVMEYLAAHVVLRKGLLAGRRYPLIGRHIGQFLASALFHTSDLYLSAAEKRQQLAGHLGNSAMCKITEDLIFDEPYFSAPMNRHTSPALDAVAADLRRDVDLKLAVQEMKWRFLNQPECLVHGDLHTGSVMVTETDTRVIDPEFAFYGPMGFDLGIFMANLLMALLAQTGYEEAADARFDQRRYLLDQITQLWNSFSQTFAADFKRQAQSASRAGLYHSRVFSDCPALGDRALERRLVEVWDQALGFAGCEMIRRIVGLSHVEDFEGIADAERRARCERHALELARELLVSRAALNSVHALVDAARARV